MGQPPEPVARSALFGSAVSAAAEGMSAGSWLRALQESGSGIRRQVGLQIYGEARKVAASYQSQASLPQDAPVPLSSMAPWPTQEASGILYHAKVAYLEAATGQVRTWNVNFKSQETLSPQQVMDNAENMMADRAEEYQLSLRGSVFTGAHLLVNSQVA